ncbi:DUF4422 domain-containing protein [Selenomonas ruminantium]|uniref:DUF4422 domain-containing protein n=1 Tax=Selenomonas ruminantium TaxID=971 RepID=UPI000428B363|nr:DUF4422 domain-containing protein [Selenomonas ruminantium]
MFIKDEILIFGQQDYAMRIKAYIECIKPDVKMRIFSFPLENDQAEYNNINFNIFDSRLHELDKNIKVIIAFSEKYNDKARCYLLDSGFRNIELYNAEMDNEMKYAFFSRYYKGREEKFIHINDIPLQKTVKIYMAKSIFDKPIKTRNYDIESSYIVPIQVGAALTNERIADVLDSTGDNISIRNPHYCEMTAFYWMWKNADADYLGLCHYRRHWVDLDKIVSLLQTGNIDAILPLPTLCEHSVYQDYLLKHIPTVWKPMMDVLAEMSPEYYEAAKEIFQGRIFYASNMCILSRMVLDDLCKWMFPIVGEVEQRVGDINDPYFNRYGGFCTERLITLYFLYNKHKIRIVHAEKIFVS